LESDKEAFSASIISWRKTCVLAARHAKFSYQRALHLSPWQANIYSDIAVTSDLITSLSKDFNQDLSARYDLCNLIIFNDLLDYCAPST
jgi:superkiller protein 3